MMKKLVKILFIFLLSFLISFNTKAQTYFSVKNYTECGYYFGFHAWDGSNWNTLTYYGVYYVDGYDTEDIQITYGYEVYDLRVYDYYGNNWDSNTDCHYYYDDVGSCLPGPPPNQTADYVTLFCYYNCALIED